MSLPKVYHHIPVNSKLYAWFHVWAPMNAFAMGWISLVLMLNLNWSVLQNQLWICIFNWNFMIFEIDKSCSQKFESRLIGNIFTNIVWGYTTSLVYGIDNNWKQLRKTNVSIHNIISTIFIIIGGKNEYHDTYNYSCTIVLCQTYLLNNISIF